MTFVRYLVAIGLGVAVPLFLRTYCFGTLGQLPGPLVQVLQGLVYAMTLVAVGDYMGRHFPKQPALHATLAAGLILAVLCGLAAPDLLLAVLSRGPLAAAGLLLHSFPFLLYLPLIPLAALGARTMEGPGWTLARRYAGVFAWTVVLMMLGSLVCLSSVRPAGAIVFSVLGALGVLRLVQVLKPARRSEGAGATPS